MSGPFSPASLSSASLSPGELAEIDLPGGRGYALATHVHDAYPEILRIVPGPRIARPDDLAALAAEAAAGGETTLYPLGAALAAGRIAGRVVARLALPPALAAFPAFKTPVRDRDGAPIYWWLWDGGGVTPCADEAALARAPLREVPTREGFLALFG